MLLKPAADPQAETYSSEVLCANWTPLASDAGRPARSEHTSVSNAASEQDVDGFLETYYRAQRI